MSGADLAACLDVVARGDDRFEGGAQSFDGRSFGGEVLAQAATAAGRTAEGHLHSLHGYFLRAVAPDVPVAITVDRLREGRRIAHRRVTLAQGERTVAEILTSHQRGIRGASYQDTNPVATRPPPEGLPTPRELDGGEPGAEAEDDPLQMRLQEPWWQPNPGGDGAWWTWVRPSRPLPDDPVLHAAALAYVSDWGSLGVPQRRLAPDFAWDRSTSLDHALWLHQPARFEDWLLMESTSDVAAEGRALTTRTLWSREGVRLASVLQESICAPAQPPEDG